MSNLSQIKRQHMMEFLNKKEGTFPAALPRNKY